MLEGKKVLVCVSGGIAAYKALDMVSSLNKLGAEVYVAMTERATKFVAPLSFETLSKHKVLIDLFEEYENSFVPHIDLSNKVDVAIVLPATANIIAKLAYGMADDAVTTTLLACKKPVIIAPAMNCNMYDNDLVQNNLATLSKRGMVIASPEVGFLACGVVGRGKLIAVKEVIEYVIRACYEKKDYINKKFLITMGGTQEPIDAVRVITNHSSGKMGLALAKEAFYRGAEVTIIKGNVSVEIPNCIANVIDVKTTNDMYDAVLTNMKKIDYIIKAAAPSDYSVLNYHDTKIKDSSLTLELTKNKDIAKACAEKKTKDQKLIIFSAETEDLIKNSKEKLKNKKADMIVANDVSKEGAGFACDTNIVTIITDKTCNAYDKAMKSEVAKIILDEAINL